MGNKISNNNELSGELVEAVNLNVEGPIEHVEPNTSTDSTIKLPILKVYDSDEKTIPVYKVFDNTTLITSNDTIKEVGITSNENIFSISYRNLYILLILILVLVVVVVLVYMYTTNTTNSNTKNKA
jgi:hypothetical protein